MERRAKTYLWIILILLVTNLVTIGSIWYHLYTERKNIPEKTQEMPSEQRSHFLADQLDLTTEQVTKFRELNRTFNHTANPITRDLGECRLQLLQELAASQPDEDKLKNIALEIGNLHAKLKEATIDFYLQMKSICTKEQQTKLYQIFFSMLNQNEDLKLPRGRHQGGKGRNSNH